MEPVQTPRVFSNRYELTHLIARGGMAQVYRARDRLLDRPVALKVLFPELSVDRAFVERFRREAQAAANLSHPNIVPVFDWGEDSGAYFIVMEFVDGNPLSAVLRESGPLDGQRAAGIASHVAAALAYAHRHGVVHRDVKPGNVLMTSDGQVKVTDFGIARAVNTEESLTQTGAVMGTAAYFSPEQAEGIGVDSRTDVYSLGVVLFEMITGRTPFLGDSPVAVASKHVRDLPPLPRDLNPAVAPALEAVVMKAMAKSPDARYATADDMRADLLRFSDGRPVTADDPQMTGMMAAVGATQAVGQINPTRAVGVTKRGPDGHFERRNTRVRRLSVTLGVLLLALLVIAFFVVRSFGYLGGGNGSFAMPNVVGQQAASATSTLNNEGLTVSGTSSRVSTKPRGIVLSTNPAAGVSVNKGNGIALVVSNGPVAPTKVTVPSLIDQSLDTAEAALNNLNLNYKVKFATSTKPSGTIIKQTPAANTETKSGTTVILTVSNAGPNVPVPNVTGDTTNMASNVLGNNNLQVGATTMQCSSSIGNGLVISTTPASGQQVPTGTTVALLVSTGPCQAPLPNVTGDTVAAAESALSSFGFTSVSTVQTEDCVDSQGNTESNGEVVGQTPNPGETVQTNDPVTLSVCSITTPTTTTTTTTVPQGGGGGGGIL